jgi:hypothetical protein
MPTDLGDAGLIVVHPDFPWSGACCLVPQWRDDVCLPALRRILGAVRRRRALQLPVISFPFCAPEFWAGEGDVTVIIHEVILLSTTVAPVPQNAIAARAGMAEHKPRGVRFVACGFWTDRCVRELVRWSSVPVASHLGVTHP